jgi:phosphoglucomutase
VRPGVLLKNGIKVYMYGTPHSVPQLSFTILSWMCSGRSNNGEPQSAAYNGYKVYGEDGGQMPVADSNQITANIEKIDDMFDISPRLLEGSLFVPIGEDPDEIYYSKVEALSLNRDIINKHRQAEHSRYAA